jgi:hypothetical protein
MTKPDLQRVPIHIGLILFKGQEQLPLTDEHFRRKARGS